MNFNKQKMVEFLINSSVYKHVNSFLPAIVNSFDIGDILTNWFNNESNLKFLYCMEQLERTENLQPLVYSEIQQNIQNRKQVEIDRWCNDYKGKVLLVANGQFFVKEYVAVKIALDLGGKEMRDVLQPSFDAMYNNDKNYERYFTSNPIYQNLSLDNQRFALHFLAELDRYWYSVCYTDGNLANKLSLRANQIVHDISIL